jgi:hypothetical protein
MDRIKIYPLIWAISIGLLLTFITPLPGFAQCTFVNPRQSAAGYQEWCRCIGGKPYWSEGNLACTPPSGGSSSGGGISTGDPFYQLGYQLGGGFRKLLFGDPEERARRQAEIEEAQRQAEEAKRRYEAEQARINEERYQRISNLLKGVEGGGGTLALKGISSSESLQLKTGTAFFGIPGNPSGSFSETELKHEGTGSSGTTSVDSSPFVQLNSAAFLSAKAAAADSVEDAKLLSEAAFEVITNATVKLEIPPEVKGAPVSQAQIEKFSSVQKDFLTAQENLQKANWKLAETEYNKRIAEQVRKEAERKSKELPQAGLQSVPSANPKEKKAVDDRTAEASKLLEDATKLVEKMTAELNRVVKELDEAQRNFSETEKRTRNYLAELGGKTFSEKGVKEIGGTGKTSLRVKGVEKPKELQPARASMANCPPYDPNKTNTVKIDEKSLCPGNLVCMTYFCGGATGCSYVCCPRGAPYLNHCDCKCYSTSDFECKSYSKCQPVE